MANPRSETAALTRLALEEIGGAVGGVGKIHRAVSDRIFRGVRLGVGPRVDVVKSVHDGIACGVYAAVGASAKAVGTLAGQAVDLRGDDPRPPSQSSKGAIAIAIISGLRGDVLEAERSALAQQMAIRRRRGPGARPSRRPRPCIPGRDRAGSRLPARAHGDRVCVAIGGAPDLR